MKNIGFFVHLGFAVLAFALLSCTEKGEPSSGVGRGMEITVSAAGQTKADDTPSEGDTIKSLQVFVFSNNKLEAVSYSESDNVTLRCFEGYKNIYAVVNHSEIGWTPEMTDEELLGTVLELKGPDDLNVMVGIETDMFLSMGTDDSPVPIEIEVSRVAAKIILNRVTNRSEDSFFTVNRVYITNVAGDACLNAVSLDYSREPQVWYNKMGLAENLGDLEDIFCSEERSVQVSSVYKFDGCFYCYPNPCEEDNQGVIEFDKPLSRWTKLVLSAQYNGKSCYYVVPLGGIQEDYSFIRSNHSYEVDLVITGFGSWDEEGVDVTEGDEGNDDEDDGGEGGEGGGDEGGGGDDEGGYKMPVPFPGIGDDKLSVKSRDRTAVINFVGGRAEVRKL